MTDALVVGTAGHIDHGKTTLVKALTGVDLDSLPEEKERGITIALGFAPLKLDDGRMLGIVDVPGHERLIRTMVAGASGLDAVLLCVSAVEGVMPQTREHLDILGLLGVRSGLLVVTMADLVDAELLELAIEEIRESVRGTFLDGAPTVAVSAVTRAGLAELVHLLGALPRRERDRAAPFRMPVDRSFVLRGFGTVVTGTAWSGQLTEGEDVDVVGPSGKPVRARVRGLQVHGTKVSGVGAGTRVAVNLTGVTIEEAPRGSWIATRGTLRATQVIDVADRWLGSAGDRETSVVVLHGTAEVEAKLLPLAPGYSQLRLAEPLACRIGDRFVFRQASPARTLGGGRVLDPWFAGPKRGRALAGVPLLERLDAGDTSAFLERAGIEGIDRELADALGVTGAVIATRVFEPGAVERLTDLLIECARTVHAEHPLALGVNRQELRSGELKAVDDKVYAALTDRLLQKGTLVANSYGLALAGWLVTLDPEQALWVERSAARAHDAGLAGASELPPHPDSVLLMASLAQAHGVLQIGERYLSRGHLDTIVALAIAHLLQNETLDPAAFRELTGHSRRTGIPILEWLDRTGITERKGDVRIRKVR